MPAAIRVVTSRSFLPTARFNFGVLTKKWRTETATDCGHFEPPQPAEIFSTTSQNFSAGRQQYLASQCSKTDGVAALNLSNKTSFLLCVAVGWMGIFRRRGLAIQPADLPSTHSASVGGPELRLSSRNSCNHLDLGMLRLEQADEIRPKP